MILSEVPYSENTNYDMLNQSVQEMTYSEHSQFLEHLENEIHSDSNIIPYSRYLIESQTGSDQIQNLLQQQDAMEIIGGSDTFQCSIRFLLLSDLQLIADIRIEHAIIEFTPADTHILDVVPNPSPSALFVPPSRKEWDLVFQPVFDEFYSPPASVASPVPVDTSQTTQQSQSQAIPLSAEDDSHDLEVAHMSNDPYFGISIPEIVSAESSSTDVIHAHVHSDTPNSEHSRKWTKYHPLQNIIGELY
ncbi:hypothetical protein Tco_0355816 [Tanacetum coccineum]